jgi:hypothetical protein
MNLSGSMNIVPKPSKACSVLLISPDSPTPLASVTLPIKVFAMCWARDSAARGRRLCLYCLTDNREIIKVVEGEVEKQNVLEAATRGEAKKVSAFDEVFSVDQVAELSVAVKRETDYSNT